MTREYSNIEIRTFAQTVLKLLSAVFLCFFMIASGVYFFKSHQIDNNNEALYLSNELYVAYKDLSFNVLMPSIYVDFENTNNKLSKLNELAKRLNIAIERTNIISAANQNKFNTKLEKLNADIVLYNGLVARAGSEYDSFNILYMGSGAAETRQNVLSFMYSNELSKRQLNDYVQYLVKAKESMQIRFEAAKHEQINLKNAKSTNKTHLDAKSQEKLDFLGSADSLLENKILQLNDELDRMDRLQRFFEKSASLLVTTGEIYDYKKSITQSSIIAEIKYFADTIKEVNSALISEQQRIMVAAIILFFLGLCFGAVNFYYGISLARVLKLFYRTFMNSPVQQSLIKITQDNKHISEVTNSAFRFGTSTVKNQSNELRAKEASNFYDELSKVLAFDDDARGFEVGTLVYESHSKLSPFDEDAKVSRKDAKFYSIYRKLISPGYELISKVDVSKKIWQIKDYKERLDNMRRKLERDSLTDLLSLQALQDNEINNPKGSTNKIFLYLHIDHFNDVRLNYSTVVIDEIIKSFANSLKLALDVDDNHKSLESTSIYHLQMDEFAIVYNSLSQAVEAAERINEHFNYPGRKNAGRNKFALRFYENERLTDLELNIGISSERDINRRRGGSDESINRLAQAIIASYESARIKAPYVIYEEGKLGVESQYVQQQQVAQQIRKALSSDNIFVVAQGVHNSVSKEPDYYELLVRMRDDEGKIVPPGLFLDIARRVGLYRDIQWVVISKAFALLERYPGRKFSINLANSDIMSLETRRFFLRKLQESKYPSNICVEILESEGIEQYDEVVNFLSEVKSHGAKVAIDDFGSGYSNYYRLLKVKFDYLKVDGSIISALPHDSNAKVVLKTIVDFAHEQGYQVVAEFVSSAEILQIIREFGIEKSQGYELSKPETPETIFAG